MKYSVCEVRVSELLTKQVTVPPWEVPILQAIHGTAVQVLGAREVHRDPPDPEEEYRRLATRYSGNKEEPSTVVALVYGTFEAGIDAIAKAINEADTGGAKSASDAAVLEGLEERQENELKSLQDKHERERKERQRTAERLDRENERAEERDAEREADRRERGDTRDTRADARADARADTRADSRARRTNNNTNNTPVSAAAIEARTAEARAARERFEAGRASAQRPAPTRAPATPPAPVIKKT